MGRERFGARVRRLREARGLTQVALARRAGVAQGHLSLIESGARRAPTVAVTRRLARALGVTLSDLVEEGR